MKNLLGALLIMVSISGAQAQTTVSQVAKFSSESILLGKIRQGTPTTATFVFTNVGKKPLLIQKTMPSCGCTAAEFTHTPIMPGKTGTVTATYNAAATGNFSKSVSVKFEGIDEVKTLSIAGEVEAAVAKQ